ncbi:MAG: relaxase domain-containing protein [Frankiaceae bacterium]|nr:relaxase domain-containing protein [Frankiaceae bacterium]
MLSVQPLAGGGGAAKYYLQHEAGCEHEPPGRDGLGYYVNDHDEPGHWLGRGAAALGLSGPLGTAGAVMLRELLDGRLGEQQLARPVHRRTDDGRKIDARRCGFDLTFSAPKSVSVLWALAEPGVAEQIAQAHQRAAEEALGLLEQVAARAARGHQGDGQRAPRIATSGMIAAGFQHTTSRAADPQLHTHVVLVNLAQGVDGRWSALDSRTLHRQATTASHLYQHLLRAELTRRLGVGWSEVQRGIAEIDGVPLNVRRAFSTRRRQIENHLAHTTSRPREPESGKEPRGRAAQLAARIACLATRPAKQHEEPQSQRQRWAATAAGLGFTTADVRDLLNRRHEAPAVELSVLTERVLGPRGVTRESSTFDQGTVLRELCAQFPAGAQVNAVQLIALASRLVRDDQVLAVAGVDGPEFTTTELVATERRALELVEARADEHSVVLPVAQAASLAARSGLRPDQQRLVFALLTSGRGVDVVTGPAGSGKTAALGHAASTWQQRGVPVAGCAVAALTAQGLQDATGARSVSLARLLHQPDRHLPAGGVLLVDEAGMIGTRALTQLLMQAEQRHCKVVLVGDPAQLPELEAGGLFNALAEQPTALHLTGHHRQREAWEQEALTALRAGRTVEAIDALDRHDRVHSGSDRVQLFHQLVGDYARARGAAADPWNVVVLASRRSDVHQLNALIRDRLRADGRLGRDQLVINTPDAAVGFAVGDQVLVTRNDHGRGLLNGTSGRVSAADRRGLIIDTRDGRRVAVDRSWLEQGQLDHGYAMTLHKAQGRTVNTALLLADLTVTAEAGYVGLSRGTHANHLYLDTSSEPRVEPPCQPAAAWNQRGLDASAANRDLMRRRQQQRLASRQVRRAEGRSR